jgi:hypothetical protein
MPAPDSASMMKEAPRLRPVSTRGGSSGCGALACDQVNRLSSAAAPASKPQVMGEGQPSLAALEKP